ncbi:MAG: GNAT family N-acetyltransferase, partial [Cyanobacteria bacterium J06576_12]
MENQSLAMSWEEYKLLEHPFGWKVEYWDRKARFSPRKMGIKTCLNLDTFTLPQQTNCDPYDLRPASEAYKEQMLDAYFDAFVNSVEFCSWPIARIQESADEDMTLYFEEKRGKPLPASVVVLELETRMLIGLALFTEKTFCEKEIVRGEVVGTKETGASLELLFVRPPHQRKGIGTAMLHHGIHHLIEAGYSQLFSRYHICNHHSRQFYHKLGFQDRPTPYTLSIRLSYLKNEIWRKEKLKMMEG